MTNKSLGKQGEILAQDFLKNKGYEILCMNFKYSRLAEIDIVAKKDNIIHFVEVKTRTQKFFGAPLEAITPKKLSSIFTCAQYYIKTNNIYNKFQIDAIGIILSKNKAPEFQHIENISI